MKIALLNTYDIKGGASKAAFRLLHGLNSIGIGASMYVLCKLSNDKKVFGATGLVGKFLARFKQAVDYLPLLFYPKWNKEIFSTGLIPSTIFRKVNKFKPDIVHLHWINSGFINIEGLANFKSPIVWTMHDMWVFTGGFHYDNNLGNYRDLAGKCSVLGSNKNNDLSFKILKRKEKAWRNLNIHFVAPSNWLAKCARESYLLRNRDVRVIPNGLDFDAFRPMEQKLARQKLNLPLDKKFVLFGAAQVDKDKRKGYELFLQSLDYLSDDDFDFVVFGRKSLENSEKINNFKVHYLGEINDEELLIAAYSACDVFVIPSVQENLSNMVVEAMACNIPVVAFNIGGMPDMIKHKENGWLAKPFEVNDLATGIKWCLENKNIFSDNIRGAATEKFDLKIVAKQYRDLYQEIIDQKNKI
jgi:glycosyltransferase involved in cell wall biosynthesis